MWGWEFGVTSARGGFPSFSPPETTRPDHVPGRLGYKAGGRGVLDMAVLNFAITYHGNHNDSFLHLLYLSAAAQGGNKNSQFNELGKTADKN
jgi:hypothetical protein